MPYRNNFKEIDWNELPLDSQGVAQCDLYIHFPVSKKFIRYALKGDVLDAERQALVKKHLDPKLYRSLSEASSEEQAPTQKVISQSPEKIKDEVMIFKADPKAEEAAAFKDKVNNELNQVFQFLSQGKDEDAPRSLEAMEKLSEQVIATVAPEVDNLRETLLKNQKYLMLMADPAAITSIAVLCAMAHGFDSRKIFRDLSIAVLLMDASMADFSEDLVNQFYLDSSKLEPAVLAEFHKHPSKSHQIVSQKMKTITDSVLQLILGHHELYNGQGYPRKVRSDNLPPLCKTLALAVDIFAVMKREKLKGREIDLLEALEEIKQEGVEPHLRRHHQVLVKKVIEYVWAQAQGNAPGPN